ncbi:MAG TPA: KOW motif-containing protein [Pyrinomonadaceae bacterium]|jgi:hypothetical protein
MGFRIEILTARLYPKGSAQHLGTAWLCSRQYLLTAAHCVVDRETGQQEPGPFQLVFTWGKLECVTDWWSFDPDAALLRVTGGEVGKIPDEIDAVRSWIETPESLDENDRTWSAYGFPAAKPSGMIIDGTINLSGGNIYGTVDGYPAIQLTCDQGGFKSIPIINPRTGQAQQVMILGGVSGAAVMYKGRILGLVRWGPPELGQKVIYATPLSSIAAECQQVANILAEHERNYRRETLSVWSKYEAAIRRRLNEEELDERLGEVAVNSPLMELWDGFVRQRGWHVDIANHLQLICDKAAEDARNFDWLIKAIGRVDCTLRYEKIVESIKKILSPSTFAKVSEIESKFSRSLTRAQKSGRSSVLEWMGNIIRVARELDNELKKLKRTISPPLFGRCFLVVGSRGAGKSHLLTSLLSSAETSAAARDAANRQADEGVRGYVLLPLGFPPAGKRLEEAILDEVEKATRQRLGSLEEVNGFIDDISATMNLTSAYLPGETIRIKSAPYAGFTGRVKEVNADTSRVKVVFTIFGRPVFSEFSFADVEKTGFSRPRARNLKLIIAIDNLEQWIEREPGFEDLLSKFIAQHSHLSHIYWLITLHDASYDQVSKNSVWRRYSIVYPITDAALQKKSYWPNIDGWLVLDEFNLAQRLGLKIIQAKQQKEGEEAIERSIPVKELETYDENSPTVRYLSNPFLAWITLGMLWDLKGRVFDLHFIEFIRHFWDKRRASLNPEPLMSENQLKQAIELMARILPGLSNLSTSLPALLDKLTQEAAAFNYEIKSRELATQAVRILLKNNLLRRVGQSQSSLPGLSETESVEMGLEIFWEYYIATEFQKILTPQTASPQQEAQSIWQKLQTIGRREGVGEGVAIFLLLLLDEKRAEDESYAGLIAEVLRLAVDLQGSLAAATWFAGAKISPETQRLLTEISLERRRAFREERRALFAYMSFIGEASPEAMNAETRLELLQPYYCEIHDAALTPYFVFIIERLFRTVDDAETLLSCMLRLTGCEVLERTRGLAALVFDRLEEILQDEEAPQDAALEIVIRYLQSLWQSGAVAPDEHEKSNEPYYFRENIMNELCRRLVARKQLNAYYLLADYNWYKPAQLQIGEPLAQEMQQQANIALGAWYRHTIIGRKRYLRLINRLMHGELAERVTAFYLVRHTITMRGPQTVRVDHRFLPTLEKIRGDSRMRELVNKYHPLFALNLSRVKRNGRPAPKVSAS